MPVGAADRPPRDTVGYLWFLRVTAVLAIPLYGMATAVGAPVEAGVIALVALVAASAIAVATRLRHGRLEFLVVGAILAALAALFVWASLR